MAKAFGLWLKEYSGRSWRAQYAAKKWRAALRSDYLKPSQYETEIDVQRRLQMHYGDQVHVPQGVAIAWLEWRAEKRVEEMERDGNLSEFPCRLSDFLPEEFKPVE
jgi:hypothetical protein